MVKPEQHFVRVTRGALRRWAVVWPGTRHGLTQLPSPVLGQHLPFPSAADKQSICTTWNISCFQLKHLRVTPQTQLTTRYRIAKAACDSGAGLRLKAEEECTWKTFLFATQCDQKHIYNCFKLFTRQNNNWHSCFLLPPVKLLFFLFAISTFWLFWWNTFCHIALLSPLLCLKI